MLVQAEIDPVQLEYERIMRYAAGGANDEALACMLASLQSGKGSMPQLLGLDFPVFSELVGSLFPGLQLDSIYQPERYPDASRSDEYDDVLKLLQGTQARQCKTRHAMARIVSQACQGQDHLWQDMGLWSRKQLSELMLNNFPLLAKQNTKDMKWKKFIYRQLCQSEGIYICRSPSCESCADYHNCYGPET